MIKNPSWRELASRAVAQWRLKQQMTLQAAQRNARFARLFTPSQACSSLWHLDIDSITLRVGAAYLLCSPVVAEARGLHNALTKLSFYALGDSLALADSVERLVELGQKLDEIDASLRRASGGKADELVDMPWLENDESRFYVSLAEGRQRLFEYRFANREGADGEWFRRVIAKRREMVDALVAALAEMGRAHEKALWMVARQLERGAGDEVELIDAETARDELRALTQVVSALTEGVGEVHVGPITRL